MIEQGGHNRHVPLLASDKQWRGSIRLQGSSDRVINGEGSLMQNQSRGGTAEVPASSTHARCCHSCPPNTDFAMLM
jgi:hypothetical protein